MAKRLRSAVTGASSSRKRAHDPTPSPSSSETSQSATRSASQSGSEYMEEEEDVVGPIIADSQKMADAIAYFSSKRIENTRAVDLDILEKIGILEPFLAISEKGGIMRKFWDIKRPAYKRLTVEFLSSLTVQEEDEVFVMRYRLLDTDYETDALELCEYMGFTPGGEYKGKYSSNLWGQISGDTGKAGEQPKGKSIQHPVIRIMQRALSNTLFARGESSSKIRKEEFMVLTRMLYGVANYPKLDLGVMMMKYWEGIAKLRRKGEGQVTIGGYVTYLAEMNGIPLARLEDLTECTAVRYGCLTVSLSCKHHATRP
ncbi:hypothetical protein LUZ62_090622 [Rhynchospora pubera]|uniref:Arabidopsis retrotransposon Orf1 C-terminal domain-containing protein n=1 Tax=Rhynchospora pubera TaxID=906938 RepID=A0AAV8CKB0_9POAL|nr:hypothetical protein LUZ62_090622 [Rhynchospora pubera]